MGTELRLHGIITALVTPFLKSGEVDQPALEEIVQFQLRSRVNGLFPLGTTGMGPAMEPEERKRVAEIVINEVDGKIPVIVQVGDSNPKTSLALARHAENAGADAVACLTPFYYNPGPDAIVEHYTRLAKETSLPLLVYNIPRNTGINVDLKLLKQLSQIPHVVGIKDSSRDFSQLLDFLRAMPDGFLVVNGTDSYQFSAFCAGAPAGVSATANPVPDLFVQMYEAYTSGNLNRGQELQKKIYGLRELLTNPPLAPLLEALKFRGLKSGTVRPPLREMNPTEVMNLRTSFRQLVPEMGIAP